MDAKIREAFPLLLPQTTNCTEFDGFINILGEDVHIHVQVRSPNVFVQMRWTGDPLHHALRVDTKLGSKSDSLMHILLALKEKLEKAAKQRVVPSSSHSTYLSSVINCLDSIGWNRVESMDENLKYIVLKAFDEADRKHLLQVCFPECNERTSITYSADFPEPFSPSLSAENNLEVLYNEFEEKLKDYQVLWNMLEEIDDNTWILEPDKPTRKDTTRRVALSKKMSFLITVDVSQPTSVPSCEFYGPDKDVTPLRNRFLSSTDFWDEDVSVLTNLKNILDIEFPSVLTTAQDDIQEVCIICYSYRLNGNFPEKTCENLQCKQTFHMECLYEWLHKLPTTRHSFNILFGECPYCNKPITCKMP